MAVLIQAATVVFGGILIGMAIRQGRIPAWLVDVELLHFIPLLWLGGRVLFK